MQTKLKRSKSSAPERHMHRASGDAIQQLERRLLYSTNVSGAITANTTWAASGSPYILTAATYIRQGATLTVQSGVTVQTSNSSQLFVSDDSSNAMINASGAIFSAQLVTNTSTGGSISGSVFNSAPIFNSASPSSISVTSDTFNAGVDINPEFVSSVANNAYAVNSTVGLLGGSLITTSMTLPAISNVSQYEIVAYSGSYNGRGLHVQDAAKLTLNAGVKLTSDNSTYGSSVEGLFISDDSSGAALQANGSSAVVSITAPLYLDSTTSALMNNVQVGGSIYSGAPGINGIVITNSAFSQNPSFDATSTSGYTLTGDTFSQGVSIRPEIVPLINSDTFAANSTISILGGGLITTSVTWSAVPNVSQYEIVAYSGSYNGRGVHVQDGAVLTLAPGIKLTSDNSTYGSSVEGLFISDDASGAALVANGASGSIVISAPLYLDGPCSASIVNDQLGGSVYSATPGISGIVITGTSFSQNPTFDAASVSGYTLTGDTFSQSVSIRPQIVPLINSDTFAPNSTLSILGGGLINTSVTWSVIPNVSQYEIVAYGGSYNGRGVHVQAGATLTLSPGLKVTTDNSTYGSSVEGLFISDDASGAKLIANGSTSTITITAPLYLDGTTTASIVNDQLLASVYSTTPGVGGISITGTAFSQNPTFDASSVSGYTLTGDIFAQGVSIQPQIIPLINTDTFSPNTTIDILGGSLITTSVTWSVLPNVTQYEIVAYGGSYNGRGVHVQAGATLTLGPGLKLTTDNSTYGSSYEGLFIADDASGAKLAASGAAAPITITAPLFLDSTASAAIINDQLLGSVYSATPGVSGIYISGTSFAQNPTFDATSTSGYTLTSDSFSQSVSMRPQLIPLVNGDTFAPNSTLSVLGGGLITTSVTWAVIPNVSQYEIVADSGSYNGRGVHIQSGATLTLAPGLKLITDGSTYGSSIEGLFVSDDSSGARLNATGVTFVLPVFITSNSGGTVQYSLFNQALTISGSSTANISYDSLGTGGVTATGTSTQTINLANNWWGTTNTTTISGLITDHSDNSSLPTVNYTSPLTYDPTVATAVSLSGSPSFYLRMDADLQHVDVWNNATGSGTVAQQLTPSLVSSMNIATTGGAGSVMFDNSNGVVEPSASVTLVGDGSTALNVIGSVAGDSITLNATQLIDNSSTITFSGLSQTSFASDGGVGSLQVNSGKLILSSTGSSGVSVRQFNSITVASSAELQVVTPAAHSNRMLIVTANLTLAGSAGSWSGTFDLGGNDLDIQNGGIATISSQLISGFNNGAWNSTGIDSLAANANASRTTTLGAILNNQNSDAIFTSTTPFDGIVPSPSDVLIKYTYYGDSNLDGKVDGSDYSLADNGSINHLTGWHNGDFNYDGTVNGSDYTLMDNAFNQQGASLASQVATSATSMSSPNSNVRRPHSIFSNVRVAASTQWQMTSDDAAESTSINCEQLRKRAHLIDLL